MYRSSYIIKQQSQRSIKYILEWDRYTTYYCEYIFEKAEYVFYREFGWENYTRLSITEKTFEKIIKILESGKTDVYQNGHRFIIETNQRDFDAEPLKEFTLDEIKAFEWEPVEFDGKKYIHKCLLPISFFKYYYSNPDLGVNYMHIKQIKKKWYVIWYTFKSPDFPEKLRTYNEWRFGF